VVGGDVRRREGDSDGEMNEGREIAYVLLNKYFFFNFKSQPFIIFLPHGLHLKVEWIKWS